MRKALVGVAALLCACGGTGGSAVTDQGHTLNPKSGVVTEQQGGTAIVLTDVSDFCGDLGAVDPCNPSSYAGAFAGATSVAELGITLLGTKPGTYTVGNLTGSGVSPDGGAPVGAAELEFLAVSAGSPAVNDTAVSGSITVDTLTAGGPASGSYDVTMQQGAHLTGTFNAGDCPALANVSSAGPLCSDDTSSQTSCSNTCTCQGKTVKAACSENPDQSFDCTCTDSSGATTTCHATDGDVFAACEQDFSCCPLQF